MTTTTVQLSCQCGRAWQHHCDADWKRPPVAPFPDVQGRCPACGGASLFLASDGYITCSRIDCPDPDSASKALARPKETQS
ncbi:DUF6085 family protein [Streptomyces sp. NPDC056387]|uniref:DUF6085 family protein n=1 Tax=Streptomyces sp. NPDC056387 TaxID=3345803 RepID=UPI0035E01A2F